MSSIAAPRPLAVNLVALVIAGCVIAAVTNGIRTTFGLFTLPMTADLGVDYSSANVLESQELREGIKAYANWPTIPQLYIKGEFVGGADIVTEMFQAGELQTQLAEKGIAVKQTA